MLMLKLCFQNKLETKKFSNGNLIHNREVKIFNKK